MVRAAWLIMIDLWNVLYSDGKSGDLWDDEMIKWNIDREAGSLCGPRRLLCCSCAV
eukprot:COSAG02_NODE_129_length_34796_cov_26.576015_21_plen_56_part_00